MTPRRIGITQRLDKVAGRDEWRDGLDERWAPLLWQLGILAIPLSNSHTDQHAYLDALALDGFILSGGNDIGAAPARDLFEAAVLKHAAERRAPVLGICRGLQFINHFQGGRCERIDAHIATRHAVTGPLVAMREMLQVNSYHGAAVMPAGLGRDLYPLAYGPAGCIEALRHTSLPWLGIMWHPERESPVSQDDRQLIQSHFQRVP